MKTHLPIAALLLLGVQPVFAAAPAAKPDAARAVTFDDGRGTFELVERLRFENRDDNFDFDAAAHSPTDDSWFVQRLRLGATWGGPGFSAQVQLQDAREWGSERPNVPFILGSEGDAPLDVRIASLTWGDPKGGAFSLTLGRQILALGDERLVGVGEWNNFARTFDAARVVWNLEPGRTTATAFVGSVVHVEGRGETDRWAFDRASGDDRFAGFYLTHKPDKAHTLDAYLLWRDKKASDPIYRAPTAAIPAAARTAAAYDIGQSIGTLGARYFMPPPAQGGGFDTEVEAAWQFGLVDRQTTAATGPYAGDDASLDHDAWALHTLVGYTFGDLPGRPRFDLEANVASGDTDRTDGKNGSFMNLFPSNHKFYGFMDAFAWKNLREFVATVRFSPVPKTVVRLDYHRFSLYSEQDAWYRANGVSTVRALNAAAQNAPRHAGDELDVTATWTPSARATLDFGWAHFFAGPYLGATGAESDADFVYVQTTLKL